MLVAVSDLIEIDGSASEDFKNLFSVIEKPTDEILIFQDGDDLLSWIFDKTNSFLKVKSPLKMEKFLVLKKSIMILIITFFLDL
mgnify:CR=1 FL=1